jgi:hypothetical protein
MPFDRRRYPDNWRKFSGYIRHIVAQRQCMCTSECGLHREHPGPRRCVERHLEPAVWARGRVILTVAQCAPASRRAPGPITSRRCASGVITGSTFR